jgi:O-acetyl-ADP-ribose deacetylase (regulator of RNase III)
MPQGELRFFKQYQNNKTFHVAAIDILGAPVEAIVNPANSGLAHGGGLAAAISQQAGPGLDDESRRIIEKIGRIPVTYAVPTKAYDLEFKGVIHAVGPMMGDGDEQAKQKKTIINSLKVAEKKNWHSVAFPALGTGIFRIPKKICAGAFKEGIKSYWQSNPDSVVNDVWLCLTLEDFPVFKEILND